jgi:hypothetical protein
VKRLHAICPVARFVPSQWAGWTVVSTETVGARAGVPARVADSRTRRGFPSVERSTGSTWDVHHLTKPMDDGGSR